MQGTRAVTANCGSVDARDAGNDAFCEITKPPVGKSKYAFFCESDTH
jgi:hypothetical protein